MTTETTTRARAPRRPTVQSSIPKACKLLDVVLGTQRWDELINQKTLSLSDGEYCVLGQTGRDGFLEGRIPNDDRVPWYTYGDGVTHLHVWLAEHTQQAEKIGANAELIQETFGANVRLIKSDGVWLSQNEQWRAWLTYRQQTRAFARRRTQQKETA
jgi:hypothetical protein